ncbi:HAMP domain-containing histidine kinase [Methylocystis sp. L43]|uniref:ATP-binding protein n=1 Tax=unclassified Methylocystis TaxID=2625913 RepID=UPI0018C2DBC3|nr:HAMP domain-containing histidine kinase [Methylocystis sp. L43]MBG0806268.1 HAMP domain-containing histidine kinase [Methylocystis sp. H15]
MTALGKLFRTTAFKLSIAYLVLFSIGAGLVLARVGARVKEVLDEQIEQTVDAEIRALSEQYAQGGLRQLVNAVERRVRAPGGSLYLLSSHAGDVIVGNIEPPNFTPSGGTELVETPYERRGEPGVKHPALLRLFLLPGGFRLLIGHDIEDHEVLRGILRRALGVSLFWLALVGALGGLFVSHRMLERVDVMSGSARRIMAGDMHERLAISGAGDELDRLAENFNAMLERISELMAGLREVSDNIAHDLKTPLTRLRNRAEAALRAGSDDSTHRAALAAVIEESDNLIGVFNALLMIARAEAGYSSDNMAVFDADSVVRDIAEMYEPVAEEQGVRLDVAAQDGLAVTGSRELLGQALVNLVDNALKYGGTGDEPRIAIEARRVGDRVEIIVADRGPGIAASDRERVVGRFVRLENSRSRPGSGLGLSLAAAVARMHHGALRIEDNAPGLRVALSLPAMRTTVGPTARMERA